ncbi:hypothetical protein, partial [Streptomyces sp. NPDC091259]|uniref:hypothetical protein n=1 Tax=Streptomyces sp. NPDC091259 TaxID=3365976 RepID=UPI003802631B
FLPGFRALETARTGERERAPRTAGRNSKVANRTGSPSPSQLLESWARVSALMAVAGGRWPAPAFTLGAPTAGW